MVAFPPPPGYDPSNEAQLASSRFAPFGGSTSKGCHSFLFEWLKKASRLSLAEPFGSDPRRHRISSRLLVLSPSASPHRLPIPLSVSKTVTFVTQALYVRPMSQVNFWGVLFFGAERNRFLSPARLRKRHACNKLDFFKGLPPPNEPFRRK